MADGQTPSPSDISIQGRRRGMAHMKLEDLKKDSWRYAVQAMVGDLTDRIRESPDDPEGYIARGRKYADVGGFQKDAVQDFSKVTGLDGGNLQGFISVV